MAQKYKQGLVIQNVNNYVSPFMEILNVNIDGELNVCAQYPAGIGLIAVKDESGKAGEPIIVDSLPVAGIDYVNKIYLVDDQLFVCIQIDDTPSYAWGKMIFA